MSNALPCIVFTILFNGSALRINQQPEYAEFGDALNPGFEYEWLKQEKKWGGQQAETLQVEIPDLFKQKVTKLSSNGQPPLLPGIELVWVRCHEPAGKSKIISNANNIFEKVTVIEKCGERVAWNNDNIERISMENLGYEGAGYIKFIVERYSNLPHWTVFLHGIPEEHNAHLSFIFENMQLDKITKLTSHRWLDLNNHNVQGRILKNSDVGRGMEHLDHYVQELGSIQTKVDFYCCMQHMVSRSAIQNRPEEFWTRYLNLAFDDVPGRSGSGKLYQHEMGVVYEHSWHRAMGENWTNMKFDHQRTLETLF